MSNVNYMIVTCVPHGAIVCAKCFPPPTITATECPTCVEVRKTVAEQAARLQDMEEVQRECNRAQRAETALVQQLAERDKVVAAQAKLLNTTVGQRVADEVAAERERCARLAGSYPPISGLLYGKDIAAAIRQTASAPPVGNLIGQMPTARQLGCDDHDEDAAPPVADVAVEGCGCENTGNVQGTPPDDSDCRYPQAAAKAKLYDEGVAKIRARLSVIDSPLDKGNITEARILRDALAALEGGR